MLPDPVWLGIVVNWLPEAADARLVDTTDDPSFEVGELLLPVLFEPDVAEEGIAVPPVVIGTVGRVKSVPNGTELLVLVLDRVKMDPVPRGTDLLLPVPREKEDEMVPVPRERKPLL